MPHVADAAAHAAIPPFYRLVFLYFEPVSILAGTIYAFFWPTSYLELTHPPSAPVDIAVPVSIVMVQLANLYLGLAILEAAVLRATSDLKVWRVFLLGLLIADGGHVLSVYPSGSKIYWAWWTWNAMDWGNLAVVYFLATVRLCLLFGVGFPKQQLAHATAARKKL